MRVLHVITGLGDGGAEAVLYRLVAYDISDTHHVISLTDNGKYGPKLAELGVVVTTLEMPRGRLTMRGLIQLWRVLRTWRADVVQTWMYHADLLGGTMGKLAGLPVVWGVHNTVLEPGRSSRVTMLAARACARLSQAVPCRIVACAKSSERVHAALGYDAARMVVIPNGYDLLQFTRDAEARIRLRAEWNVPGDLPLIGMVARYDPFKDHANLIAALRMVRASGMDFRAVLVGTGIDASNSSLVNEVVSAGLSDCVLLVGARYDIPAIMSALDIHVLSSSAEAFPNVLAEAMACGTCCVTTDVGDAARIVGETGWVVPPRCSEALAAGITQAISCLLDKDEWQQRQRICRNRIEGNFSLEAMIGAYREVWSHATRPVR